MKILIVGARRTRQGLGPFVAQSFLEEGASLVGVVGTSPESAEDALRQLPLPADFDCKAFTDLESALQTTQPNAVAVCTPYTHHREALKTIARYGVDCLCEKPLWWEDHPDRVGETKEITSQFASNGRYLDLITQWPFTLEEYLRLYCEKSSDPTASPSEDLSENPSKRVRILNPGSGNWRFEMLLSPSVTGPGVIPDSAPHPISMLQKLFGIGDIIPIRANYFGEDGRHLCLEFTYKPVTGEEEVKDSPGETRGMTNPDLYVETEVSDLSSPLVRGIDQVAVTFHCITKEAPPRPAAFGINGRIAHRTIQLPEYRQSLTLATGETKTLEDPLKKLVRNFLHKVQSRASIDAERLVRSVQALEILQDLVHSAGVLPSSEAPLLGS